eukprot:GHUV01011503.1.p1 GENE.GHUV01011503.1~~GHUV01011503.1.p1  ORF type:complete len:298 (+),score=77.41 GHUV01011503.1:190-1083(+)
MAPLTASSPMQMASYSYKQCDVSGLPRGCPSRRSLRGLPHGCRHSTIKCYNFVDRERQPNGGSIEVPNSSSLQPQQPASASDQQRIGLQGPANVWQRFMDPLNTEIFSIALPMLATLAADPIAGLVDTAYVGRLGANQLAGVGVALSVFNTTTKLFNVPLLSVTTSSVAAAAGREAAAKQAQQQGAAASSSGSSSGSTAGTTATAATAPPVRGGLGSAISSSTLIAAGVGLVQAALLTLSGGWAANLWGISPSSPLWGPASEFLRVRAIGAPITVLLLVMQVRGVCPSCFTHHSKHY